MRSNMSKQQLLDAENQYLTEQLSNKVNHLKHLSLDIEKDVKDQNQYLNNMGFDFESTKHLLKTGANRIGGLMQNGKADRKFMFYMIIGLVVGFFVLYKAFNLFRSD